MIRGLALGLVASVGTLGTLGCAATGEVSAPVRVASRALHTDGPSLHAAKAGAPKPAASEAASRETELSTFTPDAAEAEADAREAALLGATSRCPAEMALVDGRVCVDRWEASVVERVPGGGERAWPPYVPIDGHELTVRAVSRPGVLPQGYISGRQAQVACTASGKRLCAADDWETACRGPAKTQFPYGAERRENVCNDDIRAVHPVAEAGALLGIIPDRLWHEGMNQSIINQLPDTLLTTGERAACTNDYGVFDMVGNLHEWVDDAHGTFRGGYYMDTTKNGDGCAYATTAHDFTYHDYSTGFRCCMDPERVE